MSDFKSETQKIKELKNEIKMKDGEIKQLQIKLAEARRLNNNNKILKLTVDELKCLCDLAEYNYKRNNANCVILFHSDGSITQPSGYQECNDYSFVLSATVCEV